MGIKLRAVAIVQARMGSSRFPGKVLKRLGDWPIITLICKRLQKSEFLTEVVVAIPNTLENQRLGAVVEDSGFRVFLGSEIDVLARFEKVIDGMGLLDSDTVLRVTADCPLVDWTLVDRLFELFLESGADYASNVCPPTFPDGLDLELMAVSTIRKCASMSLSNRDREHVTTAIRESGQFEVVNMSSSANYAHYRVTVDYPDDLDRLSRQFSRMGLSPIDISWSDLEDLIRKCEVEELRESAFKRNEGEIMTSSQKRWQRALAAIPLGNHLLSKHPDMFLPGDWPTYFSAAKGVEIRDLDGQQYLDMSLMGVGTNLLGYANDAVDDAVISAIRAGTMSTLNCPEEVDLAERLISLHQWSDMARFAKTGGEANAVAIRLGRAYSGKDAVAVCGYHGWHDWYLSANLANDQALDQHLLSGLPIGGVPENLKGLTFPFRYNDLDSFLAIVEKQPVGVVKMEVERTFPPDPDFLSTIREVCTRKGIVLIFDECTSGFRETLGGLHLKYGVNPDIAVFGKALGNGYPITAVLGRREVMGAAEKSFISSTFWTDRIGVAAAIATLDAMESVKAYAKASATGKAIKDLWRKSASKANLPIKIVNIDALAGFSFETSFPLESKTFMTQEFLKKGMLASTLFYASTEHNLAHLDRYAETLDTVFRKISESPDQNPSHLFQGPICSSGFGRLN